MALLAVGFAALVAIVGMTYWLNQRVDALFAEVLSARDARASAVELRNALVAAESSARGFLITGNEIYLSPFDRLQAEAHKQLQTVRERFASYPDKRAALARLDAVVEEKFDEMNAAVSDKRDRRDDAVMEGFRTNRGKALMDEANVFFSGLIRAADARLTASAGEQRENAEWLRIFTTAGGVIVVVVVGLASFALYRYTVQLRQARDDVAALNMGLESRVRERTADLALARDRAEVLLDEVNHRVANSLALVSSLISLQAKTVEDAAAKDALAETQARIFAIAMIHKSLYTSGDVRAVPIDQYLTAVLDHLKGSVQGRGTGVTLSYDLAPVALPPDTSVNLGVVVTEWVTNAIKYAYPQGSGEIRVGLRPEDGGPIVLTVEDAGIGRKGDQRAKGTGLGTRIVSSMAASINARIEYLDGNPGTIARLVLPKAA